ncbi:PaaI family thioesterase [Chloroflexota bacterium]
MYNISGQESGSSDNLAKLRAGEKGEPIVSFLKMRLLELSPGYAKVAMKLRSEYLNFNDLIFGGIVMAVTDQAFAYASNSLAFPNYASQFNKHLIAGAKGDDELIAECLRYLIQLRTGANATGFSPRQSMSAS